VAIAPLTKVLKFTFVTNHESSYYLKFNQFVTNDPRIFALPFVCH